MVVVSIVGGLGNQLFQYAAGRSLSLQYNVPLKVDLRAFEHYKTHELLLPKVVQNLDIAREEDLDDFLLPRFIRRSRWNRYLEPRIIPHKANVVTTKNQYFDNIHAGHCYLTGYWQSEDYFSSVSETIKNDIRFPISENSSLISKISSTPNTVSLHVRRGDYVSNSQANLIHGVCNIDYYNKCIGYFEKKLIDPTFVIFSDDIGWAKDNIQSRSEKVFSDCQGPLATLEDMYAISKCDHHIVANSTFSWWGGWLNKSHRKQIIAPKQWYRDQGYDSSDLVPSSWIRI